MNAADPRVVVLVTPGCHLCDDACRVVAAVCAELGVGWRQTSLTELDAATQHRWREFVPVVNVDGDVHDVFRVDEARLRAALRRSPA